MDTSEKDLSAGKIKLIYEFNNSSPLFARVAAEISEQGNILEAISILEKGISSYPDYASAYFILALSKAYSGNQKEAIAAARKGAGIIGSNEVLDHYLLKIEKIIQERNSITRTKPADFDEPDLNAESQEPKFEDQLEILARKLTGAKINYNPEDESSPRTNLEEYRGEKIASDTLAEIYLSQKKYHEALSVYKELIRKNPERTDDYILKIAEIQNKIDEDSGIILL